MTLLTWCSSPKHSTKISFDNLDLRLQSSKLYVGKSIDKTAYPWISIYQESWDNNQDMFINSIIITSQNNLNIKIKDFVNNNIENLKASIWWILIQSTKILSFNCSWEKIIWIIKDFKITENNNNSYYSQFFFIENNKRYVISFQSDKQDDNLDFKNSLSSLTCNK
jgi:hypothetical protein